MSERWYKDGLRFECTQCGNCCTGGPGTVRVTDTEITELARFLGLSRKDFVSIYTRPVKGYISLKERQNYDCVFFEKESGCQVYPHRPKQCRTFPFWRAVVSSPARWDLEARYCPGINTGALHDAEFIELTILDDGTSGKQS